MRTPTEKLLRALRGIIRLLDDHWRDYQIYANVDQFYYMEIFEEITFLEQKVASGESFLKTALEERKIQAFLRWRKDYQWLCRYLTRTR